MEGKIEKEERKSRERGRKKEEERIKKRKIGDGREEGRGQSWRKQRRRKGGARDGVRAGMGRVLGTGGAE